MKDVSALYNLFEDGRTYKKIEIVSLFKGWIDKNQNVKSNLASPDNIEPGDVILFDICGQNHPCIIFKCEEGFVHGIITSTKQHEHHFVSKIEHSRIFKNSNFTSTVISIPESIAKNNFVGIFDSVKELKEAVKLIKEKYKTIL